MKEALGAPATPSAFRAVVSVDTAARTELSLAWAVVDRVCASSAKQGSFPCVECAPRVRAVVVQSSLPTTFVYSTMPRTPHLGLVLALRLRFKLLSAAVALVLAGYPPPPCPRSATVFAPGSACVAGAQCGQRCRGGYCCAQGATGCLTCAKVGRGGWPRWGMGRVRVGVGVGAGVGKGGEGGDGGKLTRQGDVERIPARGNTATASPCMSRIPTPRATEPARGAWQATHLMLLEGVARGA